MEEDFKNGDKVILRDESIFKNQESGIGVIIDDEKDDGWFEIEWENGDKNTYPKQDILLHIPYEEKEFDDFKLIILKDEITITDKEGDMITLNKEDFKKIYEEMTK